jgi:hypothetical protein
VGGGGGGGGRGGLRVVAPASVAGALAGGDYLLVRFETVTPLGVVVNTLVCMPLASSW